MTPDRCPECGLAAHHKPPASAQSRFAYAIIAFFALGAATLFVLTGAVPRKIQNPVVHVTHPSSQPSTVSAPIPGLPDKFRAIASSIDPSKTYVFFIVTSRENLLKLNIASVQVFARRDGRWRGDIIYLKAGDPVGTPGHLTSLKVKEIRTDGDDFLLTLVDADGATQTRSAKSDYNDPVRKFIDQMTLYRGQEWDSALFGRENVTRRMKVGD